MFSNNNFKFIYLFVFVLLLSLTFVVAVSDVNKSVLGEDDSDHTGLNFSFSKFFSSIFTGIFTFFTFKFINSTLMLLGFLRLLFFIILVAVFYTLGFSVIFKGKNGVAMLLSVVVALIAIIFVPAKVLMGMGGFISFIVIGIPVFGFFGYLLYKIYGKSGWKIFNVDGVTDSHELSKIHFNRFLALLLIVVLFVALSNSLFGGNVNAHGNDVTALCTGSNSVGKIATCGLNLGVQSSNTTVVEGYSVSRIKGSPYENMVTSDINNIRDYNDFKSSFKDDCIKDYDSLIDESISCDSLGNIDPKCNTYTSINFDLCLRLRKLNK